MSIRMMGQAQAAMTALQQKLDTVGHNLANSNTHGYKARQVEFQSLLKQHINNLSDPSNRVNRSTPDGIRVGTGARLGSTNSNLSIGALQNTDRALDTVLLNENHFYQIQVNKGGVNETHYTRAGNFYVTPLGNGDLLRLVTSEGHPVQGVNGPIEFNAGFDSININSRGEVLVSYDRNNEVNVGRLDVVEITRPRLLQATGENGFRLANLAELGYNINDIVRRPADNSPIIENYALEMSNVQMQEEMLEMINAQRAYQLNARSISTADQMQGLVSQLR
ncbi:MAG TPA: flagellar hook-basal body protein [Pseudogracilibacillus sp.]|nr:flagellar hook-basal body protein [Pseudogracilibacillus sp.]